MGMPILLELDGNRVKVDEFFRSTTFVDSLGDGLTHRASRAEARPPYRAGNLRNTDAHRGKSLEAGIAADSASLVVARCIN